MHRTSGDRTTARQCRHPPSETSPPTNVAPLRPESRFDLLHLSDLARTPGLPAPPPAGPSPGRPRQGLSTLSHPEPGVSPGVDILHGIGIPVNTLFVADLTTCLVTEIRSFGDQVEMLRSTPAWNIRLVFPLTDRLLANPEHVGHPCLVQTKMLAQRPDHLAIPARFPGCPIYPRRGYAPPKDDCAPAQVHLRHREPRAEPGRRLQAASAVAPERAVHPRRTRQSRLQDRLEDIPLYRWKWDLKAVMEGFEYFEKKWGIDMVSKSGMRNYMILLNHRVGFCSQLHLSKISVGIDKFYFNMKNRFSGSMTLWRQFKNLTLGFNRTQARH